MAIDIDTLLVKLAADTSQMRGELAKATTAMAREMQKMAKETEKLNSAFAKVGNVIRGAVMGALSALSVSRLIRMGAETLNWADELKGVADRIGISTDSLQELIFAGREMNITAGEMTKGIESFAVKFAEAAAGKGRGVTALKELGIDARDAQGQVKSLDVVFAEFSQKIQQFDRSSQLAIAKAFFGDEGAAKFLEVLGKGPEHLERLRDAAREAGAVVSGDLVASGERLNQQFEKLTDTVKADLRGAFLSLTPVLNDIMASIDRVMQRGDLIKKFGIEAVGPMLAHEALGNRVTLGSRPSQRGAEDASMAALAALPGKKRANLDPSGSSGSSALEGFEKKIAKVRHEAAALNQELRFDKATAANVKAMDEFAEAVGKVKPNDAMQQEYSRWLKRIEELKGAVALKEFATQNQRLVEITNAEVAGNRELVAVLEARFALEDKLGQKLSEKQAAEIEAMARTRHQIEEHRKKIQDLQSGIAGHLESGMVQMTDAFSAFFDKNRNGWQEMGQAAIGTLRAIAQEILLVMAIRPLAKAGGDWLSGLLGSVLGGIGGGGASTGVGSILGGITGGLIPRAAGGPVMAGVPYLVGERRPELFVPNTSGTIMPRVPGGGTVNLYGSDSATVEIGQLKGALRQMGMKVNQLDRSVGPRAVAAVHDARRRPGPFADA